MGGMGLLALAQTKSEIYNICMKILFTLLSVTFFSYSAAYAQAGKILKGAKGAANAASHLPAASKAAGVSAPLRAIPVKGMLPSSDLSAKLLPRVQQAAVTANKKIIRQKLPLPSLRTGSETFGLLQPGWKVSLALLFSSDELATVETALQETDKFIFAPLADDAAAPAETDWNYEDRFALELKEAMAQQGFSLTSFQYKTLLGGKGKNYDSDFPNLIKLISLEAYLNAHGFVYPVQTIFRNGRFLKASEMTPDEYAGRLLAKRIDHAIFTGDPQNPIIQRMILLRDGLRPNAAGKTPQEWLAELETWLQEHPGSFPNKHFAHNGKRTPPQELTEVQYQEYQLRNGLDGVLARGNAQDPVVRRIIELKENGRKQVPRKTAEEWLQELENWLAAHNNVFPKATFSQNGKQLKASELPPEQAEEKRLSDAVFYFIRKGDPQDPVIQRLAELKQKYGRERARTR